jgi:hypothetical protein
MPPLSGGVSLSVDEFDRDLQFGKIDIGEVKARSWHGEPSAGVRLSIG